VKSKRTDLEVRYILLFKLDAYNLFQRIHERQHEYIDAFSLKRNRAVFKDIFDNRYKKTSILDLSHCTPEIIEALNSFYTLADEMYWYLKHTQDMPNMIQDEVSRFSNKLRLQYDTLALYIDAELTGEEVFSVDFPEDIKPASDDVHNDQFTLNGEEDLIEESEEYLHEEIYPDLDGEDSEENIDNAAQDKEFS
jgi:hypothetical protein